jgi:transcriptional/translational regulatory protein YebC/TACO1
VRFKPGRSIHSSHINQRDCRLGYYHRGAAANLPPLPPRLCRRSSKIATRKGKADAQKAKLYGKIGKLVAQAVRLDGPDPVANTRLREALAAAKMAQVPVDIIERNIKRASESKADYAEVTYEGACCRTVLCRTGPSCRSTCMGIGRC